MEIKNKQGKLIYSGSIHFIVDDLDLREAMLEGAIMEGAHFDDVNLGGANLRGADLYWTFLQSKSVRR
jgi:uncharacterized protein YjbI with pentapeptide repeats